MPSGGLPAPPETGRQSAHLPSGRDPADGAAAGSGAVANGGGGERPSAWLSARFDQLGIWLTGVLDGAPGMAVRPAGGWDIPGDRLGGVGNAAPHGHLFPSVYVVGGSGLPAPGGLRAGPRFQRAGTCGKQALTMCMSLGCAACGVTGCRIIDSPRERLVASLTACLVPWQREISHPHCPHHHVFCGRDRWGLFPSLQGAALLLGTLLLGVAATLGCSKLLSSTVLRGVPSSFTLELPPFRRPTGRPGAGALGAGSDSLRAGPGSGGGCPAGR